MCNITIFGTGNIGSAVAGIAVKAGATVQVIDRNPDKAAASAEGVTGAKFGEAITGDIVVLALPFPPTRTRSPPMATNWPARPWSTCPTRSTSAPLTWLFRKASSPPRNMWPPSCRTVQWSRRSTPRSPPLWPSGVNDGEPTVVQLAADDEAAKNSVKAFIEAAGLKTVDAGALKRAQYLEGYGALQIVLGVTNQTPWTGGFKVVK